MNAADQREQGAEAPLPFTQFKRFVNAFHAVFMFALAFSLLLRFRRPGYAWSWNDPALLGMIALQVALYVLFMVRVWKPPTATAWWLAYFVSGGLIWLLEWRLEEALHWTIWAYVGQAFGVLRPAFSVPIALASFATYFGVQAGFKGVLQMNIWQWIGTFAMVLSFTLLGIFFYRLTVTSTERAKLIDKLEAAQRELEKARARDEELATLRERERLARELHDSLGHGLVTLSVQLEAAQRLYQVDPPRASALMENMKQLTRSSMEQLRRALAGLRAPGLGERALFPAVQQLCREVSARGSVRIDCRLPQNTDGLSPAVVETLWRVVQEALANVEKHSQAQNAAVELLVDSAGARVRVTDDGVGIPSEAEAKPGHYGLRGLRERVEGLGGNLSVSATVPKGTALQASIPLPA